MFSGGSTPSHRAHSRKSLHITRNLSHISLRTTKTSAASSPGPNLRTRTGRHHSVTVCTLYSSTNTETTQASPSPRDPQRCHKRARSPTSTPRQASRGIERGSRDDRYPGRACPGWGGRGKGLRTERFLSHRGEAETFANHPPPVKQTTRGPCTRHTQAFDPRWTPGHRRDRLTAGLPIEPGQRRAACATRAPAAAG